MTYLADTLPRLTGAVRLNIFATRQLASGRRRKPQSAGVGWQGWNPDALMADKMARLSGSGSFYWQGAINALVAAKRMMRDDSTIHQVAIETISGQPIARLYRPS